MKVLDDRWYTDEHEWVLDISENRVRVGITDFAQDALGDVVYVELPSEEAEFARGETMAEVESTKSVADVYAPVAGSVAEANEALRERPELVNSDPYGDGWFVELTVTGPIDTSALLNSSAYEELTGSA